MAVVLSLILALITTVVLIRRSVAEPKDDLSRLKNLPSFLKNPARSDFYNFSMDQLRNQLAPRESWTKEEALYLAELVKLRYPESVHDRANRTEADIESQLVYNEAVATISERFTIDGPMDEDARQILEQTLLAELDNPVWSARLIAVTCIVQARLPADPKIRARVERLASDPNQSVAENVTRQLAHYDLLKASDKKR